MYRLLIVDDEAIIANGIKASMNWNCVRVTSVSIASNARQAKEKFAEQPFDIMICDIEMPQGSGLELYEWVKEHYPQTECIFITCHADFHYAKKALQLGSFEYLLKPVPPDELMLVMTRLINKIRDEREAAGREAERFWQDVLSQAIPSNWDKMREVIQKQKLPYSGSMEFIPVVISISHWEKTLSVRDAQLMEYALRNALEEIVVLRSPHAQIVRINPEYFMIIFPRETMGENEQFRKEIHGRCIAFIEGCNRYLGCHLSCYFGKPVPAFEVRNMAEELMAFKKNQVNIVNRIIFYGEQLKAESEIPLPPIPVWSELIKQGHMKQVIHESQQYLDAWKRLDNLGVKALQRFYQNFLQMMLYTLQQQGLRADEIFSDYLTPACSLSATRSVNDLQHWVRGMLEIALDHINKVDAGETIIEKIKRYIALNLDQELSRQYIADYVGLSPDYIVKLFKKETGLSVSDYILTQRIQLAKELLAKTDTTISNVALSVGFCNFSYFSTLFKKEVSMTPQEYRREKLPAIKVCK
jgi:Response regulator containing CheY-like receiver domain and AraC-type DNA-binding domain